MLHISGNIRPFPLFFAVFVCSAFNSGATTSDAQSLLLNGDYAGARALMQKEYRENPADPATALLYAETMQDAATALEFFKRISTDTLVPDSLRSQAYFRCACAAYVKGRFQKANGYLKKAVRLSADRTILEARYLAGIHDTADTAFLAWTRQQAADTSSDDGKIANYFLGLVYVSRKDFTSSLACFNASAQASDSLWWTCASIAGAYTSAVSLSRSEEAASILVHLKRVYPRYLEKALTTPKAKPVAAGAPVRKDTTAVRTADTAAQKKEPYSTVSRTPEHKSTYSLQVGAFGSADNAGSLRADLGKRYSPVSVMAVLVQDKPIYRVRVGVFTTKENAQAFGDTALTKKGLKFRVVEDVPVE
jgi:cell division septation protein DedD